MNSNIELWCAKKNPHQNKISEEDFAVAFTFWPTVEELLGGHTSFAFEDIVKEVGRGQDFACVCVFVFWVLFFDLLFVTSSLLYKGEKYVPRLYVGGPYSTLR